MDEDFHAKVDNDNVTFRIIGAAEVVLGSIK